jgi:CubicO group peptidase (beta-lactamase class C family)
LRERIARPLGMTSTGFVLDDDEYARLVERPPEFWGGSPETGAFVLGGPEFAAFDGGMGGGKSTAPDLAIFAQTILNGGAYGDARILSRAAVAAMTRNHLPGIPANLGTITKAESGYGYGWISDTYERWAYFHGTLQPIGVIGHTGAGGNNVFVDRDNEIIIVVLELVRTLNDDLEPLTGLFDRFQNVIYSAVDS